MAPYSRKYVAVCVLLILVFASCYWMVAKLEPTLSPLERVEALVAPFTVKHNLGEQRQLNISLSRDQRELRVARSFGNVELKSEGGTGISGFTSLGVSVFGWDHALQEAVLDALNASPESARAVVNHEDERIQLLALKALHDWGHGHGMFGNDVHPRNGAKATLEQHAIDALLSFAKRSDPHFVGSVVQSLVLKPKFDTEVFLAGMAHGSSNIRAETLRWLSPERQQLTSDESRAVFPVLIEHLTDRDLVVRQWSMISLQSLVAYCENRLGGAPIDEVRTDQSKMVKLPIAPVSNRWYQDVNPPQLDLVKPYQDEWRAWLRKADESL
jgi:hypothetical protein